jgi:hypothetical protein
MADPAIDGLDGRRGIDAERLLRIYLPSLEHPPDLHIKRHGIY